MDEISTQYGRHSSGEQDRRIREVLVEVDPDDGLEAFLSWSKYLQKRLTFPFNAKLTDCEERGPLQVGDQVKVIGVQGVEDLYGVLIDVRTGRRKYVCPLCELRATDENSPNYELVDDYSVWFGNR